MAMTKKERAEFDAALAQARILGALRWTATVAKDVPAPSYSSNALAFTEGWTYNTYSGTVELGWSESNAHGKGPYPAGDRNKSAAQGARALFSTESKALAALRHALELQAAEKLAAVDRRIAELAAKEAAS
jgi:hypothetical protein